VRSVLITDLMPLAALYAASEGCSSHPDVRA
jgi:hypothetical protein